MVTRSSSAAYLLARARTPEPAAGVVDVGGVHGTLFGAGVAEGIVDAGAGAVVGGVGRLATSIGCGGAAAG